MALLFVLAGVAMTASNSSANTLLQSSAPEHLRGKTVSLFMLAMRGGLSLGSLLTGFSVHLMGVRSALAFNGVLALLILSGLGWVWRQTGQDFHQLLAKTPYQKCETSSFLTDTTDISGMQVSSSTSSSAVTSTSSAGGTDNASQIAALQKQLRQLTQQLKDVTNSDGDAKTKQKRAALLQAQIRVVQAQISALQQQQQQEKLDKAAKALESRPGQASSKNQQAQQKNAATPVGLGQQVDVYV